MARLNVLFDTRAEANQQAKTLRNRFASVLVFPKGKKFGIAYDPKTERTRAPSERAKTRRKTK